MRKNSLKKSFAIVIISMFALLSMFSGVSSTGNSTIEITNPAEGCWYVDDVEIASGMDNTRIWGVITIEVDTFNDPDISFLIFYIDDNFLEENDVGDWTLEVGSALPWGTHEIKVDACDSGSEVIASASIEVIKVIKDEFEVEQGVTVTLEHIMEDYCLDLLEMTIIEKNLILFGL